MLDVGEHGERVGLPPGPVVGEHEQLTRPFPQRLFRDDLGERGGGLDVPAGLDVGRGEVLDGGEAQLGEAGSFELGVVAVDAGERGAAPQVQGGAELPGRGVWVGVAGGVEVVGEPGEVEVGGGQ